MSTKILVVGASRGIGLELAKQLSSQPDTEIFATMRKPFSPGFDTSHVKVLAMDQTDASSVAAAASQVPELDTLILSFRSSLDCIEVCLIEVCPIDVSLISYVQSRSEPWGAVCMPNDHGYV